MIDPIPLESPEKSAKKKLLLMFLHIYPMKISTHLIELSSTLLTIHNESEWGIGPKYSYVYKLVPCSSMYIYHIIHKPRLYSLFAYQIASVMAKCHDCFSYPPKFVCFCFIVHNAKPRNPIYVFQTSTWWNCSLFIFFKYFFLITEVSPGVEPKLPWDRPSSKTKSLE